VKWGVLGHKTGDASLALAYFILVRMLCQTVIRILFIPLNVAQIVCFFEMLKVIETRDMSVQYTVQHLVWEIAENRRATESQNSVEVPMILIFRFVVHVHLRRYRRPSSSIRRRQRLRRALVVHSTYFNRLTFASKVSLYHSTIHSLNPYSGRSDFPCFKWPVSSRAVFASSIPNPELLEHVLMVLLWRNT
jgi:hypothetical protein